MPKIECILHGSLEDNLPADHTDNRIELSFSVAPSVNDVLARLNLDREYLQYILADGHYIELEDWNKPIENNVIQLWPRISGG